MEVDIVAKEVIKPSSLTTNTYKLSFLDQQFYGSIYIKLVFFYHNSSVSATEETISGKTRSLKASLSEVLTHYYPLAGKIKDKYSIYTGVDDGVEFIEARVNGTLSENLAKPNIDLLLTQLVSDDYIESLTRPLLIIQASFFPCGGLAIGVNISHRVADASSFACFMNAWAVTTMGNFENHAKKPDFSGFLIFPPSDRFVGVEVWEGRKRKHNLVRKRFVFSKAHIICLQEKATQLGSKPPSRVQTISAFLWTIGMKMLVSKSGGYQISSILTMPLNLRSILPPPICDQSIGNLFEFFTVHYQGRNTEIPDLSSHVRMNIVELRNKYQNKIHQGEKEFIGCLGSVTKELESAVKQDTAGQNFWISSWCNFSLYDVNFGWGKPSWVANPERGENFMVLMDTSDGNGIEAWVSLPEDDMVVFASDEELLANATIDPSVI